MVAVPRLHKMKYAETRQSAEIVWTNETFENRFLRQFPVYYGQTNIIRGRLIWTSWRPRLKIWAYGLKFLGVFTPKRPILKTLAKRCETRPMLLLITNQKSSIGFQMTWKSMPLDDLEES